MKRAYFAVLVVSTVALLSFSLSENPLDKLVAGFKKYLDELPQEKVYLHFDRPYYTSGETIWFNAYLTAGAYHEPSPLSRTIYVELINSRGQLIKQLKLLATNGLAAGDIALPDPLESGNYLVRAYTNWMRNGDEDYFFHRLIKIWNREGQTSENQIPEKLLDIRFFPEGGDLVSGIASKVAFKAIGGDGLGRELRGKVIDENGEVVCAFKSNRLGMGAFLMTPQKNKRYKAIIERYELEVDLPAIKESGLVMSVRNSPRSSDIVVGIQTTDHTSFETVYILAQTRGVVCYTARVNLSLNIAVAKIDKSCFPGGVTQITITDHNGIPIAERLVFVDDTDKKLSIEISTDKTTYSPRELVNLQIQANDVNGKPVMSNFSLSVCDDQQVVPDENCETISNYLFLSSELNGYIESPGYYFNPANEDRAEALDYLLMTQGWRRFTFKRAMETQWQKPEYNIEQGLTIRGKMVDKYNHKSVADGKVSYLTFHPLPDANSVRTNSRGEFEIDHVIYYDSAQTVLQGETRKGHKAIELLIDTVPDFPGTHFPLLPLNGTQTEFEKAYVTGSIERRNIDASYNFDEKTILLKELEIHGKREDSQEDNYRTYGPGSVSIRVADNPFLETYSHPLQLIQGRVAGVLVTNVGLTWEVQIRGAGSFSSAPPLIMIDNMPVDIESLNMLPVSNVESVDVWKGPDTAIFGARGANGAVLFYTKRGRRTSPPTEGTFTLGDKGFQTEREFYVPKYDVEKPEHIKPDKRATIFWSSHIHTDSLGHASVSFYNHDLETTVTGTLEGISITGKPGNAFFKYTIRKN